MPIKLHVVTTLRPFHQCGLLCTTCFVCCDTRNQSSKAFTVEYPMKTIIFVDKSTLRGKESIISAWRVLLDSDSNTQIIVPYSQHAYLVRVLGYPSKPVSAWREVLGPVLWPRKVCAAKESRASAACSAFACKIPGFYRPPKGVEPLPLEQRSKICG